MLTLHISKSRSKSYPITLKLSGYFDNVWKEGDETFIDIEIKEVFEKWEFFNNLFWMVVDWKGTTLKYDNMTYHSHRDMTRIFYALQQAHSNWINIVEQRLSQLHLVHTGDSTFNKIYGEVLTDDMVNHLIDAFLIERNKDTF